MPLFYFDVHDGSETLHDEYGDHWNSIQEAADHAASILPALAAEIIPEKKPNAFVSIVRNEDDFVVYRSVLLFHEDWPEKDRQRTNINHESFSCVIAKSQELMRYNQSIRRDIFKTISETISCVEQSRAERDLSRRARECRARRAS